MYRTKPWGFAIGALFATTSFSVAGETVLPTSGDTNLAGLADTVGGTDGPGILELSGGVGITFLEANEIVYTGAGSSDHLSQLIWQSTAPTLSGSAKVNLPGGWNIKADAKAAMNGNSYMEDYDWFGPFFVSYDFNDWTHRSQHDATNLDWYFNGSLLVGRDFKVWDGVTITPNAGIQYTDVQWTAFGGTGVYSDTGYRDLQWTLSDSVKGLTYRQQYPAIVAGLDTEIVQDQWTFDLSAHAGFTFNVANDDQHWLRDRHTTMTFQAAPIVSLGASANYQVSDGLQLYLSGTAEKIFTARGNTDYYYSNTYVGSLSDNAGSDLFSASITGGIKGTF